MVLFGVAILDPNHSFLAIRPAVIAIEKDVYRQCSFNRHTFTSLAGSIVSIVKVAHLCCFQVGNYRK